MTRRKHYKESQILSGWKEIANYLRKGVRTVQRYERELGLPVRRPAGESTGSVMATKVELDAWVAAAPFRDGFQLTIRSVDNSALLNGLKLKLEHLAQLKLETEALRKELSSAVQSLRQNLEMARAEKDPLGPFPTKSRADVLMFDPKRRVN